MVRPSDVDTGGLKHKLINYMDTKAKCRHLKKMNCKGTLRQVFIKIYRLEIHSVMLVFRPSFVNCCPSNILSGSTLRPPPPLPCQSKVYTDIVWLGGGWGMLSPVEDHILQEFNIFIWPDLEPTKLLDYPQQQTYEGRSLRQLNACRKVPLKCNFFHRTAMSLCKQYCDGQYK